MSDIDKTAGELFDAAFNIARDARSEEYKNGVLIGIRSQLAGQAPRCPHPAGTAQADAWIAGHFEGRAIGRQYLRDQQPKVH